MSKTITKTFKSHDTLSNVREDLIATGIEQEQIFVDKDNNQVKVIIPAEAEPEILEIMNRHQPID
ncbi:MAG TPA: hypothetical protein ENJ12_03730 [Thiolapillus brandeum]|uniref:DUF2007 domain-containing protein n=1 Tax=Thiolapillus brandeum TaxID=1076588 RepID=A0A831RU70_9GAMM|nr:hypothetical protein [Thiolapillus brandeum]